MVNVAHVHLKVWVREDDFIERWGDDANFKALREASRLRKKARNAASASEGVGGDTNPAAE